MNGLKFLLFLFLVSCSGHEKIAYKNFRENQKKHPTSVGSLAYQDLGKGSPIILLHGVPTSSWMYRKVIGGLSEGHRVIPVDLIGYGGSSKPKRKPEAYRPAEQARRVRGLAKSLGLKKYSLMFHDMGGLVAWEMLRQDREAISNLIVLNTIIREEGFNPPDFKPGAMTKVISKAMVSPLTNDAVLGLTFKSLGLGSDHKLNSSECFGYVQPLREGGGEALYEFYTSLNPTLYRRLAANQSVFRKFKGRTLVLWGTQDKILTEGQLPFLRENLGMREEDIYLYPKNDHYLVEEIPGEVVKRVSDFLARDGR